MVEMKDKDIYHEKCIKTIYTSRKNPKRTKIKLNYPHEHNTYYLYK